MWNGRDPLSSALRKPPQPEPCKPAPLVCRECGKRRATPPLKSCEPCRARRRELRELRIESGKCVRCGNRRRRNKQTCRACGKCGGGRPRPKPGMCAWHPSPGPRRQDAVLPLCAQSCRATEAPGEQTARARPVLGLRRSGSHRRTLRAVREASACDGQGAPR